MALLPQESHSLVLRVVSDLAIPEIPNNEKRKLIEILFERFLHRGYIDELNYVYSINFMASIKLIISLGYRLAWLSP